VTSAGERVIPQAPDPGDEVTRLYREHALSLIRIAHIMLGNRTAAEDVVQEAFCSLYRRWEYLTSKDRALGYVRSCVLNGCRSARRKGRVGETVLPQEPHAALPVAISAEAAVLSGEERREVVRALRQLTGRQREVLVLRYYLELPDDQIARDLGLGLSTIRSTRHRALAALARLLREGT
jgi:RNA polymerase sigma-70 factor (sigma-E family)